MATLGSGVPCSHSMETAYRHSNSPSKNHRDNSQSSAVSSPKCHVEFNFKTEEGKDKRKKFLTAKYGQHQMMLIRKRLAVEEWLFDQLRILYDCEDDDYDCQLELDDLMDYDTDVDKRDYAMKELANVKQSPEVTQKFVTELIQKSKTL